MNKIQIVISAEQFIKKDYLYGLYNGQSFKDYLEFHANELVDEEINDEEVLIASVAKRINTVVEQIGNELFITASEREDMPYKGDIYITPTDKINIEEALNAGKFSYSTLLANEYIRPTIMDKREAIIRVVDDLTAIKKDYKEIAKTSINGVTFDEMLLSLPSKMDDNFDIDGIQLDEYINAKYNQYSLRRYNSVDSRPVIVETIPLTQNAKDVENPYKDSILRPEDIKSLVTSNNKEISPRTSVHQTMINIYNGINLAKNPSTLHQYDDRLKLVRDSIETSFKDDNVIKTFYQTLGSASANLEDQQAWREDNLDDVSVLYGSELGPIKEELVSIERDRLYSDVDKRLLDVKGEIIDLKGRAEKMGVQISHELEQANRMNRGIDIINRYSRDNKPHQIEMAEYEIIYLEKMRKKEMRKITTSKPEQAAIDVRIEKYERDIKNKLDAGRQNGIFTDEFCEEHSNQDERKMAA